MNGFDLFFRPEKDWKFQVGDLCVLNSGSPILVVYIVMRDGRRVVYSPDIGGLLTLPSICLRPHSLLRILGANS